MWVSGEQLFHYHSIYGDFNDKKMQSPQESKVAQEIFKNNESL